MLLLLLAVLHVFCAPECPLHPAPGALLHNAFIDVLTPHLHFLVLFLPPFWCGGLCAAHGISQVGAAPMSPVGLWDSLWGVLGPHVGSCFVFFVSLGLS